MGNKNRNKKIIKYKSEMRWTANVNESGNKKYGWQ